MTGAQALAQAVVALRAAGVDDAPGDARWLLAHVMDIAPGRLTLVLPEPLPGNLATRFAEAVARRAARVPVSHILGRRAFWGRDFLVTPDVLDPRPDSEALVAAALAAPFDRVLDLGTGSGCLLLTLLAERAAAVGWGVDISPAALEIAGRNATALGVADRAQLALSDWFADVTGRFDLIIANPPYIAADEMPALAPEVRDHEPHLALTDGADGLTAYRIIAGGAPAHLAPGGRLIVEIGWQQGAAVAKILTSAGLGPVRVLPDLAGRDRVVVAQA